MKLSGKLKQLFAQAREWVIKHRKIVIIVGCILAVIIASVSTYLILSRKTVTKAVPKPTVKVTEKPAPELPKYYSPLTGKLVNNQAEVNVPVTGVMIENSPEARPQSGLKDSGIVFEAIAEGGITRFLVLYQAEKPQMIGPVRSLRLYDIDWLAAFNSSIAHVGGSASALNEIRNGKYRDIDQFFNSKSYWRSTDRYAPHNVYTSFERLDALNLSKGYISSTFKGFTRVDGKPVDKPDATDINIAISSYMYNSNYVYDKGSNTYARNQAGEPHLDRESGQISPSVVIAMSVDEETIFEDGYRQSITTIGSGNAVIFQNGTAIAVTWNKASQTDQITFTDSAGKDVPLVRGQTWIAAIPNGNGGVTWK